jgi:hypothetical protein
VWRPDFPAKDQWFHPTLTSRGETQAIFETTLSSSFSSSSDTDPSATKLGPSCDGAFLVRKSVRLPPDWYVLSLCFEGQVRNFEVRRTTATATGEEGNGEYEGDEHAEKRRPLPAGMLFIDDGPLFESLEELINHHMTWTDGLYCLLSQPIPPRDVAPPPYDSSFEESYEVRP